MDVTSYLLGKKTGGGEVNNQNKDVTITENGSTTVSADAGYTGLGIVGISTNVQPDLETKSVTIIENGTTTVTPTAGKDGLSQVSVTTAVAPSGLDEYFKDTSNMVSINAGGWSSFVKKLPSTITLTGNDLSSRTWSSFFQGFQGNTIPKINSSIKPKYMTSFFASCINIEEINIKNIFDNIDFSENEQMYGTFQQMYKLKSVNLTDFDTSNVKTMAALFAYSGRDLTGNDYLPLDLTPLNMGKVTDISEMFRSAERTKTINMNNCDLNKVVNVTRIFDNTYALENLTFGINLGKGYLTTVSANYSNYKLDLSKCSHLTHDSLMSVINNLYDIATAGVQPQQLVLGATNLAKLSSAEIAIATNKGWTVS